MSGGTICGWPPLAAASGLHPALLDPWDAARTMGEGTVIALLVTTEGPAYRSIGTAIAIAADGHYAGAITSGCIEAELIRQAANVRAEGLPKRLRYGAGSPFFDLKLPCGGAIEVMLFPLHGLAALEDLAQRRAARLPVALSVSAQGHLSVIPYTPTRETETGFTRGFRPPLRFVTFGAGPEPLVFASLVTSLGYDHTLLSHDEITLSSARATGGQAKKLALNLDTAACMVDAETAITLFYHDHDREPALLRYLLTTDACYIGAQGGHHAQQARYKQLLQMGVPEAQLARLRAPIGLIPSARDAHTLAVSVLAEIMDIAKSREISG
jgi:xanthine dehydrogenase accessory factor